MKTELTQEQKRIKIAEACGWKWEARIKGAIKVWNKPPLMVFHDDELPDYFNDLNAMPEAEKVKEMEFNADYVWWLGRITCESRGINPDKIDEAECRSMAIFATAAQRAEAFGKTLGLW